jgi:hypothetical protein
VSVVLDFEEDAAAPSAWRGYDHSSAARLHDPRPVDNMIFGSALAAVPLSELRRLIGFRYGAHPPQPCSAAQPCEEWGCEDSSSNSFLDRYLGAGCEASTFGWDDGEFLPVR